MTGETTDRRQAAIPGYTVIVALAALLPLLLTLGSKQFVADDYWFAGHANMLDGKPSGACSVWRAFTGDWLTGARGNGGWLRPITRVVWRMNDSIFTIQNPWGYHLTNAVVHAANAVLCALLMQVIIARAATRHALWRASDLAPILAGLAFAWFPPSAGAVSWVSGRTDLLAVFFLLLAAFIATAASRAHPVTMMIITALACLSKESGFITPLLLAVTIVIFNRGISFSRQQMTNIGVSLATVVGIFLYRRIILGTFGGYSEQTDHLTVPGVVEWFFGDYLGVALAALFPSLHVAIGFVGIQASLAALILRSWPKARLRGVIVAVLALSATVVASAGTVLRIHVTEIENGRLLYFAAIPIALTAGLLWRLQEELRPRWFFAIPFAVVLVIAAFRFAANDRAWTHASQQSSLMLADFLAKADEPRRKPHVILYERMDPVTYEHDGMHVFEGAKLFPWDQAKWAVYRASRGRAQAEWGLHAIHIPTGARISYVHAGNLNIQDLEADPAAVIPIEAGSDGTYSVDFARLFADDDRFQYVCLQVETTSAAPLPPLLVHGREIHPMLSITSDRTPSWFYALGIFPGTARDSFRLPALDNSGASDVPRVSVVTFPVRSLE